MIDYRSAGYRDINTIVNMEIENMKALREEIGGEFPEYDERHNDEPALVSIIEGNCGYAVVAEASEGYGDNRIVGALIALDEDLKVADEEEHDGLVIRNLFVDKEYRRAGIATSMLAMAEEWALAHNYRGMRATINTPNEAASTLFEGHGISTIAETRWKNLG
jgi:GNAT superfamily N-acetyltransferase